MDGVTIDECINDLKASTMFHMSLGSKELFHSNFLHWISIVNWDAFLKIMHGLAEVKEFWWEKEYRPEKNNVKVFREHRNFDLSIYVIYTENNNNNDKVADDDDTIETNFDSFGNKKVQRRIPVLVLENKMKSLPYKGQLEEYTKKAFEEWRKGETLIKSEINKLKSDSDEEKTADEEWINKHGITFVLLSLMDTKIGNDDDYKIEQELSYRKKGDKKLKFPFKWNHTTYCKLVEILGEMINKDSFPSNKDLDQSVVKDYKNFVTAFCNLAEKWKIKSGMNYRSQIFPWNIPEAHAKTEEINKYKELRIHDIHEKILYNQLLRLLEGNLTDKGLLFKRYNSKTFKEEIKNNKCRIFTNSTYAHGVGIVEAFYAINDEFKLYIQVQGDRYCHMVIYKGIVSEGWDSGKKTLSVNMNDILKNGIPDKYISINGSKPSFPWGEPSWGRYGNDNIYQFVKIPQTATIKDVIDKIVEDFINYRLV